MFKCHSTHVYKHTHTSDSASTRMCDQHGNMGLKKLMKRWRGKKNRVTQSVHSGDVFDLYLSDLKLGQHDPWVNIDSRRVFQPAVHDVFGSVADYHRTKQWRELIGTSLDKENYKSLKNTTLAIMTPVCLQHYTCCAGFLHKNILKWSLVSLARRRSLFLLPT